MADPPTCGNPVVHPPHEWVRVLAIPNGNHRKPVTRTVPCPGVNFVETGEVD